MYTITIAMVYIVFLLQIDREQGIIGTKEDLMILFIIGQLFSCIVSAIAIRERHQADEIE